MGTNTMVAAVGLVIGPVLGGALVAISGTGCSGSTSRSGSPAACGARSVLHEVTGRSEDRSFDFLGTITFLIGLTGLVLRDLQGRHLGLGLAAGDRRLIAAAVLLPAFVLIERRHKAPMLDLSDLPATACSRPPRPPRSSTAWRGSR